MRTKLTVYYRTLELMCIHTTIHQLSVQHIRVYTSVEMIFILLGTNLRTVYKGDSFDPVSISVYCCFFIVKRTENANPFVKFCFNLIFFICDNRKRAVVSRLRCSEKY